ncbi:hypothetical protein FM120_15310 [Sphingobacterium faecium PCAi_F2.5]|nr:hypothetical protein FM120_15310 [Sphingobacterium faecium PCAi_F2.5]
MVISPTASAGFNHSPWLMDHISPKSLLIKIFGIFGYQLINE